MVSYWANELVKCGTDAACLNDRRIGISAAFFVESEFQQTGSFVYRLYASGLGRRITFSEFRQDRQMVKAGSGLQQSRSALADSFVQRAEFVDEYKDATTAESFVDALLSNIWLGAAADLAAERSMMIALYQGAGSMNAGRSEVLQYAVEDKQLREAAYNSSFVLMQYFGYLQRDPDEGGYQFWLNVLNNREPNNYRGMVCSFLTSAEYQKRFSSVVSHSNSECR